MRVLSVISLIFTIIVVIAIIVFFAIEKTIPINWAKQTIIDSTASIAVGDYTTLNEQSKMGCYKLVTEYAYSDNGIKVAISRIGTKVELVGTGEERIVRKKITEYDLLFKPVSETEVFYYKKGELSYKYEDNAEKEILGSEWQSSIVTALRDAYPVITTDENEGSFLFADLVNNIESVSQIGIYVTGHAKNGDDTVDFTFDFLNRQLKGIKHSQNTITDGKITATTVTEYQIQFPTKIELPEAVH